MQQVSINGQRPLGELFSELARETGTLVRKEVQLAKIEMTAKAEAAGRDAAIIAGGGTLVALGVLVLTAAAVFALALVIPLWASALIVGAMVTITGGVLVVLGVRAFKGLDLAPRKTMKTHQEDKRWLHEQMSR